MTLKGTDYGDYEINCEINKDEKGTCHVTGEKIPEDEISILFYSIEIRFGNEENLRDILGELEEVGDKCKRKVRGEKQVEYMYSHDSSSLDYVCTHCGEEFEDSESLIRVKIKNNYMKLVEYYKEFHFRWFKDIIDIVINQVIPDVEEDYGEEIVASRI